VEAIWHGFTHATEWLTSTTAAPTDIRLALTLIVGSLLSLWRPADKVVTVAHEGGHALAALVTRRPVLGVQINSDGSGATYTRGRLGGLGSALVTFAGYPFPGIVGAGLIIVAVSGHSRSGAAVIAVALLAMLWRTRNLHGWLVIGLCLAGVSYAAWALPSEPLALAMAGLGALLLVGAGRDLLRERQWRRSGRSDSDISILGGRGLPASLWWTVMVGVVVGSGWLAWEQVTQEYLSI